MIADSIQGKRHKDRTDFGEERHETTYWHRYSVIRYCWEVVCVRDPRPPVCDLAAALLTILSTLLCDSWLRGRIDAVRIRVDRGRAVESHGVNVLDELIVGVQGLVPSDILTPCELPCVPSTQRHLPHRPAGPHCGAYPGG